MNDYDWLERVINEAINIASTISRRYTLPQKSNRELSACHSNYFNAIATSALNAVLTHLKRWYEISLCCTLPKAWLRTGL